MRTIGIRALRSQLSECVRLAGAGKEQFNIACHGKVLARLCSKEQAGEFLPQDASQTSGSEAVRFSADKTVSKMIQERVRARLLQLQSMTIEELRTTFREEIGYPAPLSMTQHELQLACGRAFQYKMWIEKVGAVPGDIGLRDLSFWYRLLLPQNLTENN